MEDDDPRDFFVKAKPKSVRPMKMTDAWRFEAMEAVIEAARLVTLTEPHSFPENKWSTKEWPAMADLIAALDALKAGSK